MAASLLRRGLRVTALPRLLGRGVAGRPEPPEPLDPALQEVERALQRRRRAIWLRRLRRELELEPAGPPPRSLSWEAMEQIRYLRQAFPEEWPVARLAQGFQVSVDVIQRVLRSRFSAPWERRVEQDAKVLGKQGSQKLPAGPGGRAEQVAISAGEAAQQLLPSGPRDVPQPGAPLVPGAPSSSSVPQRKAQPWRAGERQSRRTSQLVPLQEHGAKPLAGTQATRMRNSLPAGDSEEWDGRVLSEEELEELAADGWDSSPRVVRRGQEFFDSNGNFLYRLLAGGGEQNHVQPLPPSDGKSGSGGRSV